MKILFTESQINKTLYSNSSSENKLILEMDNEYNWGAGIMPICKKTGKILLQKRGAKIVYPNQWCTFGGKGEEGESHEQAARREFKEESGYKGRISNLKLIDTHRRPSFTFYNYICLVSDEFKVTTINKVTDANHVEVSDAQWCDFKEKKWGLKGQLHFGLKRLMNSKKKEIEKYIRTHCDSY